MSDIQSPSYPAVFRWIREPQSLTTEAKEAITKKGVNPYLADLFLEEIEDVIADLVSGDPEGVNRLYTTFSMAGESDEVFPDTCHWIERAMEHSPQLSQAVRVLLLKHLFDAYGDDDDPLPHDPIKLKRIIRITMTMPLDMWQGGH